MEQKNEELSRLADDFIPLYEKIKCIDFTFQLLMQHMWEQSSREQPEQEALLVLGRLKQDSTLILKESSAFLEQLSAAAYCKKK